MQPADRFFLRKIRKIIEMEQELAGCPMDLKVLAEAIPAAKAYVAEQIEELGEESQAFDPSF